MALFLLYLASSVQDVTGYNFHLMDSSGRTRYAPARGHFLLINDGGTVNNSVMSSDTRTWLCRMLGYQSYGSSSTSRNYTWMQSLPVRYGELKCSGSVVPQCRYKKDSSSYSKALWIYCKARRQYGDSKSFYLVDKDKKHTQKGHGLLMYNGGTVRGNKFDDETADLICQIMGYLGVMGWSIGRRYKFQDTLPIKIEDLNCLTRDRAFPLCTYGTNITGSTHDNDIWLWCDIPNTDNLVCPPGNKKYSFGKCLRCPANTYSPDPSESSSCLSCPSNSTSPAGSTFCSCAEGTYMSSDGDECLECPANSTSLKGSIFCTCYGGTYLHTNYGSCVQCPNGTISRAGSKSPNDCVPCPERSISLNEGKTCSCAKGYGWEWSTDKVGSCKACPSNFYKDKEQGICRQCPLEATSLPLSDECKCPNGLSWDGNSCVDCLAKNIVSEVCTCEAGTFWSVESSQCDPCPDDHVGNGTTNCSECPEGTSPSEDKTICQKSSSDVLSIVSLAVSALLMATVIGNIVFTWSERRKRIKMEKQLLVYRAEPSTMSILQEKVTGSKCLCPSCPCSEVAEPALPKSGTAVQQDDTDFT